MHSAAAKYRANAVFTDIGLLETQFCIVLSVSVVRYSLSIWVLDFHGIGLLIYYVSSNLQLLNILCALESPHLYVLLWN